MANNCLLTKLKGVVDNDNLEKFNTLRLTRISLESPTESNSKLVGVSSAIGSVATIVGDGYFSETFGGSSIGKSVTFNNINKVVYTSNGNYTIEISNKSDFNLYNGLNSCFERKPISDFYYTKTQYINREMYGSLYDANPEVVYNLIFDVYNDKYSNITGDWQSILRLPNLYALFINPEFQIKGGDIGDLATFTRYNFTNISTPVTSLPRGMNGSIENLVARLRGMGHIDGKICFNFLHVQNNVTFQGNKATSNLNCDLTWTSSEITFDGRTISNSDIINP